MNWLLAALLLAGTMAALRWLRGQQRRIEFDHHWETVVTEDDWSRWSQELSA